MLLMEKLGGGDVRWKWEQSDVNSDFFAVREISSLRYQYGPQNSDYIPHDFRILPPNLQTMKFRVFFPCEKSCVLLWLHDDDDENMDVRLQNRIIFRTCRQPGAVTARACRCRQPGVVNRNKHPLHARR